MELMPHIKALLDDLIDMTKHVVIKRTDIANRYENNSRTLLLYQQCAEILDGNPSFFSYNVYPKEVLRSYGSWVEDSSPNFDIEQKSLTGLDDIVLKSSKNMVTISKRFPDTVANIGDYWVHSIDPGSYVPFKEKEYVDATYSYELSKTDSGTFDENNIISKNDILLYVHNTRFDKFIPVRLSLIDEFVTPTFDEDGNDIIDSSYFYDINDETKKPLKFKRDELLGKMCVLPNDSTEDSCMYHRSKIDIYHEDETYWEPEDMYFIVNQEIDSSKYISFDNMHYVPAMIADDNSPITFKPLYTIYSGIINDDGTGIDEITNETVSLYKYDYETKNYVKNTDNLDSEITLYTRKEYSGNVYLKYFNIDRSRVINYTYMGKDIDGNIIEKLAYAPSTDNESNGSCPLKFELYYSYASSEVLERSYIRIVPTIKKHVSRTIDSTGEFGMIEVDANLTKYYIWRNTDPDNMTIRGDYISIYNEDKSRYEYKYGPDLPGDKYNISDKAPEINSSIVCEACIYVPSDSDKYYVYKRNYSPSQVNEYYLNRDAIPEQDREAIKDLMGEYTLRLYCPNYENSEDFAIPQYTGETNRYYRELNGLPAIGIDQVHPTIARFTINPSYEGTNTHPYLWQLTDAEIDVLEDKGYLQQFQKNYPDLEYLKHLGRHRIDVIKARQASPFDLLYINPAKMSVTSTMFSDNYKIAKTYIMRRHYTPNMFGMHRYYHAYVGFSIMLLAMNLCIEKSGDILIQNKFMDQKTVDIILESYGFKDVFSSIPLIYRREIAKNILKLIKNKGIDSIYNIIYNIFNMTDVDIYKYFFRKLHKRNDVNELLYYVIRKSDGSKESHAKEINGIMTNTNEFTRQEAQTHINESDNPDDYCIEPVYDLSISQVPYDTDSPTKYITDESNTLSYDDITSDDNYWGVYESNEIIKEKVLKIPFNVMNSKYITLNNRYSLTELNFNSTYLLNYLLDSTILNKNTNVSLSVEGIDEPQKLSDLIIALFAIQAIKLGYDGNIPSDIVSTAAIMKFNFSEEIAKFAGLGSQIINKYYKDLTSDAREKADEVLNLMELIRRDNSVTNSIKSVIRNDKTDLSVNDLTESYVSNIIEDDILTAENDASLYNKLIDYRESAKDLAEFRCFDELIHCISVCDEVSNTYKLSYPIWELMYEESFDETFINSEEHIPGSRKLHYTDITKSWTLLNDIDKVSILNKIDAVKVYHVLKDDTVIEDADIGFSKEECFQKNASYRVDEFTNNVYFIDDGNEILCESKYSGKRYRHFNGSLDDEKTYIVTSSSPICYSYNDNMYIVNIGTLTNYEICTCSDINDMSHRISIYKTTDLFKDENLDIYGMVRTVITSDISNTGGSTIVRKLSIGNNNTVYISNQTITDFLSINTGISGSEMYIEVIKDQSSSDRLYTLKIYKRCESALTYMMWIREMSETLYEYMRPLGGEISDNVLYESEYVERMSVLGSTIIATIESAIESKELKEKINLSYIDFENITQYIKLLINVFKSYTIDLSSMDAIFNIDDIEKDRYKIIDDFYSHETFFKNSNLHLNSTISYSDNDYGKEVLRLKDELEITLGKTTNKGGN